MSADRPTEFKLGKKPAVHDPRNFRLTQFLDLATLPTPPAVFGHQNVVANTWGMLGNDRWGDCVWAGAAHETMMWTRESTTYDDASFNDQGVLADYSAVTGFNSQDPQTDQGTDMTTAATYRRKVGVLDSVGRRHKVGAFLGINPGNIGQTEIAAYLFSAVGIGIQFPASAADQFRQGKPWDVVAGSQIEGGHYVPLVGKGPTYFYVVTWGRLQRMTPRFYAQYCDEALAYLSPEMLTNNVSPEGFDLSALRTSLAALRR